MSDEVFHDVAYKAKKREHLLAGIDEFLGKQFSLVVIYYAVHCIQGVS